MTDPTVYLMPLTFGFGPASHAVAIGRALRSRSERHRLVGLGDGIAVDLMRASGIFDEVVTAPAGELSPSFGRSDGPLAAVSVADFDRARAARAGGVPTVVVDALYWMWDQDPIDPADVDRYLCLEFPSVADRIRRHPRGELLTVIPQILDVLPPRTGERKGIVLNFGGAVAPFGTNGEYLRALVHAAVEVAGADEELLVTCSGQAGDILREGGLPATASVVQLPPAQMLKELGGRALLLTLPGLSIMWEALRMEIPTVVLPGANYSQHRQVAVYRRYLAGTPIITWDELDGYAGLPPGLPEDQGGDRALALGRRFAADPVARKTLTERLRTIVGAPVPVPSMIGSHPWSSFDGADHVAREVADLFAGAVR